MSVGGGLQTLTIQKLNTLHRSIVIMTIAELEKEERERFCFKKCFHNLIVAVVCVLFKTFRDYS